ncbi:MAG TPA: glycosyltransferase family 2 protein [Lacisediminihabitans sp.]|uniref:glycosyltransferase family 2 protein n=1 Tax=Lacisediminihabitans sp. TaxID=2787631 RepID=UPI002ED92F1E
MIRPTASVVLPLHNAAPYLSGALRQLAALDASITYEFIVIDDHSTDATQEIVSGWSDAITGRLIIEGAQGSGVSAARNQALELCSGDFVWFADVDDLWSPTIVSELVAAIGTAEMAVCNARKSSPDGSPRGEIVDAPVAEVLSGEEALLRVLEGSIQGHLWNKLFRRSALSSGMFPATRAHSDLGGLLSMLPTFATVAMHPMFLYIYVLRSGSVLNGTGYQWEDLQDCYEIASVESRTVIDRARSARAITVFKYRNLIIPTANELARRRALLTEAELRGIRRQNRRRGGLRDLGVLFHNKEILVQAALVLLSPALYERVYRARRATSWTPIAAEH